MVRLVERRPIVERAAYLGAIALDNARALERAVLWCAGKGVGAFRVQSQLFPLATHPTAGYDFKSLPSGDEVMAMLKRIRDLARSADIRLSFHPDQFVTPGSIREEVVASSLRELEHQAEVAEHIGAEQLTIHGGGAQPGKAVALVRLQRGIERLSDRARRLVVLENDDRIYTVEDLLPVCEALSIPLVYDVHHHRCNPDKYDVDTATDLAAATWGDREPWVHLSSSRDGWDSARPGAHSDYIRVRDVPQAWLGRRVTVDIEAKAKERAVLRLARGLNRERIATRVPRTAHAEVGHDLGI